MDFRFSFEIKKHNDEEVVISSSSPLVDVSKLLMETHTKKQPGMKNPPADKSSFMYAKRLGEARADVLSRVGLGFDEKLDVWISGTPERFSFLAKNLGALKKFNFQSMTYIESFGVGSGSNCRDLGEGEFVFVHCSQYDKPM